LCLIVATLRRHCATHSWCRSLPQQLMRPAEWRAAMKGAVTRRTPEAHGGAGGISTAMRASERTDQFPLVFSKVLQTYWAMACTARRGRRGRRVRLGRRDQLPIHAPFPLQVLVPL
jgi:hypothetical protein